MNAGYSGTPLTNNLGIKPGYRLASVQAPDGYEEMLRLKFVFRLHDLGDRR